MAGLPYDAAEVEKRWQARWDADPPAPPAGELFYNLVEFPYPSAEGLYVGHVMTYCGADVVGRYRRMQGSRRVPAPGLRLLRHPHRELCPEAR